MVYRNHGQVSKSVCKDLAADVLFHHIGAEITTWTWFSHFDEQ